MDKLVEPFLEKILRRIDASSILAVDKIQNLWGDYGAIYRLQLQDAKRPTVVVKCINFQAEGKQPKGWTGSRSHQRKIKSYEVENYWYQHYAGTLPEEIKVPQLLYKEEKEAAQVLVMEDLSIVYPNLKQSCSYEEAKNVVKWLAAFHAHFLNSSAKGLWETGSYWHLSTRPDEWEAMKESPLKQKAKAIDQILSQAKFQTIIHGDAKVANFCFGNNNQVAAVDFQYVGKGIGVKDLAYFIGSCFTSEECELYENKLLDCYFNTLENSNQSLNRQEYAALEKEWRALLPVAWADFNRFLLGWSPEHKKLHAHAMAKNEEALKYLESYNA